MQTLSRRPSLIFIALLLLCSSSHAHGQTAGRSVRGNVRAASGEALRWTLVHLLSSAGTPAGLTVTDNDGAFSFQGLQEQSYIIVVKAADYSAATWPISFAGRVNQSAALAVEIRLTPQRTSTAKPAFTQNVPPAARATFDRAVKIGQAGKKEVALTLMQEAARIYPDYFEAHFALGNEFMKAGRFTEAINELNLALKINPSDDQAYQSLGFVLMRQRKFTVAAALFNEAARLNPTEALHPLLRAMVLLSHAYALTSAPQNDSTSNEWTSALTEAETSLTRADTLSRGQLAPVHLHRARLHELKGEAARAANELARYLQMNPQDEKAADIRAEINRLRSTNEPSASPTPE